MQLATNGAPPGRCRRVIQRDRMIAELSHRFASNLVSIEEYNQVCLHMLICNHDYRLTFLKFVISYLFVETSLRVSTPWTRAWGRTLAIVPKCF